MMKPLEFDKKNEQWIETNIYECLMYAVEDCNNVKNPHGKGHLADFQRIMRGVYNALEPMILELNEKRNQ